MVFTGLDGCRGFTAIAMHMAKDVVSIVCNRIACKRKKAKIAHTGADFGPNTEPGVFIPYLEGVGLEYVVLPTTFSSMIHRSLFRRAGRAEQGGVDFQAS